MLVDLMFVGVAFLAGLLILFGYRELLPRLLRVAFALLLGLALLPLGICWMRGAFMVGRHELDAAPVSLVLAVVVGHVILAVTFVRQRFGRAHRPDPRIQELERLRGRERTRLPPRGEG